MCNTELRRESMVQQIAVQHRNKRSNRMNIRAATKLAVQHENTRSLCEHKWRTEDRGLKPVKDRLRQTNI